LQGPQFSFSFGDNAASPPKETMPKRPPSNSPPSRQEPEPPSGPSNSRELADRIRQEIEREYSHECQKLRSAHTEELKAMESQFNEKERTLINHMESEHTHMKEQNAAIDVMLRWIASHPKLATELVSALDIENQKIPNPACRSFIQFISNLINKTQ